MFCTQIQSTRTHAQQHSGKETEYIKFYGKTHLQIFVCVVRLVDLLLDVERDKKTSRFNLLNSACGSWKFSPTHLKAAPTYVRSLELASAKRISVTSVTGRYVPALHNYDGSSDLAISHCVRSRALGATYLWP